MRLEHANITVESIDEAKKFLKAAFPGSEVRGSGFMHEDESKGDWVHFGTEDSYIALQQNRAHKGSDNVPYERDGVNHLGFVIEDLDELITRMASSGYSPSPMGIIDLSEFRRRVYFFDGNGFEWEFIQYLSEDPSQRNQY